MKLVKQCRAKVIPFSREGSAGARMFCFGRRYVIKNEQGKIIEICSKDERKFPGPTIWKMRWRRGRLLFRRYFPEVIAKTLREIRRCGAPAGNSGDVDGVRFINDSKGTNPDASIKAIEAMKGDLLLIAGGYDKGSDYEEFINAFQGKVKHLVLLGKPLRR